MARRLITVEGTEGAGKTTAMVVIADWLRDRGERVVVTREPGGTALGEELREVLLAHRQEGMSAEAEVLLMFAARAEHLERVIRPAIEEGAWVICDRFTDASVAYQGAGRRLGIERVEALADWLHPDIQPGLTFWLDLPVAVGLARAAGRSAPDRFEAEQADFFERIRAGYADIAERQPHRVQRVDASRAVDSVKADIKALLQAHYQDHPRHD